MSEPRADHLLSPSPTGSSHSLLPSFQSSWWLLSHLPSYQQLCVPSWHMARVLAALLTLSVHKAAGKNNQKKHNSNRNRALNDCWSPPGLCKMEREKSQSARTEQLKAPLELKLSGEWENSQEVLNSVSRCARRHLHQDASNRGNQLERCPTSRSASCA